MLALLGCLLFIHAPANRQRRDALSIEILVLELLDAVSMCPRNWGVIRAACSTPNTANAVKYGIDYYHRCHSKQLSNSIVGLLHGIAQELNVEAYRYGAAGDRDSFIDAVNAA
jgi:hypothetical protein